MNKVKQKYNLICDDRGSTLVTVIVAIGFITVLASILISTTLLDARMKAMDRKSKDEFYFAEKGINDIYAEVGEKVTEIAADAYESSLLWVGKKDGSGNSVKVNNKYKEECAKKIYEYLKEVDESLNGDSATEDTALIKCVESRSKVSWAGVIYQGKTDGTGYKELTDAASRDSSKIRTIMKDVTVTSTYHDIQSVVTTDIIIDVPNLDFFGENEDIGNYAIIASEGLNIEGGSDSNPNVILGNVYAGVGKNGSDYEGGISIKNGAKTVMAGDYIVSHGNIEIDNNGTLTINSKSNLDGQSNIWTESIIVGKKDSSNDTKDASGNYKSAIFQTYKPAASDRTKANIYALNDLKLEGNGSTVRIAGNYYGYNPNLPETVENKNKNLISATNSSIIINGYSATLDMKDVSNLIINGKAYIQMDNGNEVSTAESMALKTNQQMYLLPTAFLNCANPAIIEIPSTVSTEAQIKAHVKKYFKDSYVKESADKWWADNLMYDVKSDTTDLDVRIAKDYTEGSEHYVVAYAYIPFITTEGGNPVAYKWNAAKKMYDKQSNTTPGTDNTVTAETAFFNTILECKTTSNNPVGYTIEPMPFTIHEQVFGSIKNVNFFDLKECILGDTTSHENAQIFASEALVEYTNISGKEAKRINNTINDLEASGYKQNLYHRYRNLCFALDGMRNVPLNDSTSDVDDISVRFTGFNSDDWWDSKYPVANILTGLPSSDVTGPAYTDAGVIEFCTNKTINSSRYPNGFEGIVIADTITVDGTTVRGLLIAKKKINIKNSKVMSDQGMIERRIANEIASVRDNDTISLGDSSTNGYLIKYLKDARDTANKYSDADIGTEQQVDFNYNNFMHYENWQKGSR